MSFPVPLECPTRFTVTAELAHELLSALCERSPVKESEALARIREELADPVHGPLRGEHLFVCLAAYTAAVLLAKLPPNVSRTARWEFRSSTGALDDSLAQQVAQAAVVALLQSRDLELTAVEKMAPQVAMFRDAVVDPEWIEAGARLIRAVARLAMLGLRQSTVITAASVPAT